MNITRRFFIGGAASFGAFGGCRMFSDEGFRSSGKPKIKFGVVSDIHITKVGEGEKMSAWGNNLTFKHTLEWFRDQGVDAVLIAGDMADNGMVEQLQAVAQAWYAVFPNDCAIDGRKVEKVFVYGNHDWEGWRYGDHAARKYPDEAERNKHILAKDYGGWWQKIFNEEYSPIYIKDVKGYKFIGQHWDRMGWGKECQFGLLGGFMDKVATQIDPAHPFFYVQHPHPKDTCYGPWAWGHDTGHVTGVLSKFPNAVAFSGHSHYSLTDERSVWQGAFTSVGTSSLRYTGEPYDARPPVGYENTGTEKGWKYDAVKMMRRINAGDCRQGMLWEVYEDCMVVHRREFLSNLDVGPAWVIPTATSERPFAFAMQSNRFNAPQFVPGGELTLERKQLKNRGGKGRKKEDGEIASIKKDAVVINFPPIIGNVNARIWDYEVTAQLADGTRKTKLVMAENFHHALGYTSVRKDTCVFALDELAKGEVAFTVTPQNCFGKQGKSLTIKTTI